MDTPDRGTPDRVPLASALKGLGGHVLALLQVRLELLSVEAREALQTLLALLAWGAVAVVGLGLGIVLLAAFLTVLLWDTHRLLALGVLATLFLAVGAGAVWMLRRTLASMPALFQASARELQRDREQFLR